MYALLQFSHFVISKDLLLKSLMVSSFKRPHSIKRYSFIHIHSSSSMRRRAHDVTQDDWIEDQAGT